MANRHISSNIRLVLDLIDYSEYISPDAILLFLDFYKAFDSIEHSFIFEALKIFGFGDAFIRNVSMLYKDITSTVLLYPNVSKRFPVLRGVRQGCPLSTFLFLIAAELLFLHIENSQITGINIFQKEIKITQLADDCFVPEGQFSSG